ncbi:MAG: type IV secretory system conjugative DNA transfer family protein [bacterium]|nr:type IV secretory system conjugative DNA transfer family protein [bacterium]
MKLKFKAEASDVMIFIAFSIFLFYIVCLGILNFPYLAIHGQFYGLNPLPALQSDKIAATLMLYFLFLGGIFMSVSSYFFERESGVGLSVGQKSGKGYSRWAKEKEIKGEEKVKMVHQDADFTTAAGVPLLMKNNQIWVDDGEYHNLVIGATGSGKTQTIIFPTVELLAKNRESMIITDPKGEIYEQTSNMLRDKGYNVLVLNFRDPQEGNCWNPLSLPYHMYQNGNQDKAIELLDDLAANILYEEKSGNADPFWEKTSADYFAGLALGMFEDTTEDKINLNSISLMTTIGEEKFGGSTFIKEYFNLKDPASAAYTNASGTIMAPNETKGSIISVFKQKIKLFASRDNLSEMLSHSDIDLASIGEKPTALFIVIQDEKKTYHSLVTILLKQCYETLIDVAQKHGGKLPVRTNFLLDEFANMPPLKDITTMITAARSRLIRFTMIIQNFAQLDQVYGKENAETIKGNCGNIIYLITTELKALEEISKMCGEVKSKKDDKTASTPLVTISDLQKMKQFEVIIMRIRMNPFKTKFIPYFQWKLKKYEKAEYPHREKVEVCTFDLREFVKEKKKEKLMEMMNNPDVAAGGGMMPPFPGMGMSGMPGVNRQMPNMTGGMNLFPGISTGMGGTNPMSPSNMSGMNSPKPNSTMSNHGGFDVDDLVKKIDAKIAEIEAEEKRQQAAQETTMSDKKIQPEASAIESTAKLDIPKKKGTELKVEPNVSSKGQDPSVSTNPSSLEDLINTISKKPQEKKSLSKEQLHTSSTAQEVQETPKEPTIGKPIIHEENIQTKEIDITDDQFFDDFFED